MLIRGMTLLYSQSFGDKYCSYLKGNEKYEVLFADLTRLFCFVSPPPFFKWNFIVGLYDMTLFPLHDFLPFLCSPFKVMLSSMVTFSHVKLMEALIIVINRKSSCKEIR